MIHQHCVVCNDARKFKTELFSSENILRRLKELKKVIIPKEYKSSEGLKLEVKRGFRGKNIHMMCGHCRKIDSNELKRIEDKLIDVCGDIYSYLKTEEITNGKNKYRYQLSSILGGSYPTLSKLFDRI